MGDTAQGADAPMPDVSHRDDDDEQSGAAGRHTTRIESSATNRTPPTWIGQPQNEVVGNRHTTPNINPRTGAALNRAQQQRINAENHASAVASSTARAVVTDPNRTLHPALRSAFARPSERLQPWVAGNFYKMADRIYFAACRKPSVGMQAGRERFNCFTVDFVKYYPFCDDFGPYNLASVLRFNEFLKRRLESDDKDHVFCCQPDRQSRTNAVFLIGAFLVLERNMSGAQVMAPLNTIQPFPFEPYRDATFGQSSFSLNLVDCWEGLAKGSSLGWLEPRNFEMEEYEHYDDPGNGDLHMIVPDKLIAFKGPTGNLPMRREWFDKAGFDPKFYIPIFQDINVTTVVRLNDEEYDREGFTDNGINHVDLYFDDCTVPPPKVVVKFLQVVERTEGTVAVHCKAGLGRTGTLIALYLMKHYEFSAREAIGWIRILRPGSVIGRQQQFLVDQEQTMARARERSMQVMTPPPALTQAELAALSITVEDAMRERTAPVDAESQEQAREVAEGMERRSRAQGQQEAAVAAATVASVAERILSGNMDVNRTASSGLMPTGAAGGDSRSSSSGPAGGGPDAGAAME